MQLTKDAKSMLYTLYKEYESRRKQQYSRSEAKYFDSAETIQASFFPSLLLEDVEDPLRELGRNGFLKNRYASDTIYECHLTDYAISVMESQAKETLLNIAEFISRFIP